MKPVIKIFQGYKIEIRPLGRGDTKRPEEFQDYINSLIDEEAMILMRTKKTKKEEAEWLKSELGDIKSGSKVCLVAEYNGRIIGSTRITLGKEREDHIGTFGISIKSGYRGIGLGKYLMAEIIKLAKKIFGKKLKIIKLFVFDGNKPAIGLYKKMGFKQVAHLPKSIQYKGKLIGEFIMLLEV